MRNTYLVQWTGTSDRPDADYWGIWFCDRQGCKHFQGDHLGDLDYILDVLVLSGAAAVTIQNASA